jgi:hypothetical protein
VISITPTFSPKSRPDPSLPKTNSAEILMIKTAVMAEKMIKKKRYGCLLENILFCFFGLFFF